MLYVFVKHDEKTVISRQHSSYSEKKFPSSPNRSRSHGLVIYHLQLNLV